MFKILKRQFHVNYALFKYEKYENPIWRTVRILGDDLNFKKRWETPEKYQNLIPKHCDVLIIGGGATGSSIAYWLKEKSSVNGFDVCVIEKDLTLKNCATALSAGSLRSHFSLPETVEMSLFGAEFIRTGKERFDRNFNVNFQPYGNLILANEKEAGDLEANYELQRHQGAVGAILNREQLKQRFPWMEVRDVELGYFGLEKEGWFEAMTFLNVIQEKAVELGAKCIEGEVEDFLFKDVEDLYIAGVKKQTYQGLDGVVVKLKDGSQKLIKFSICVIAAGYETKKLCESIQIGTGDGLLSFGIPLNKMHRRLCYFSCTENPPSLNTPMVLDHTGLYFRRHDFGGNFIAGISKFEEEKDEEIPDEEYFENNFKPILSRRVPAFNNVNFNKMWRGICEYNSYDMNGIIGPHPYYTNLFLATGFSGHGIQLAPAVGRGVAELILDARYTTIDLSRLSFDRFIVDKPMFEIAPY